MPFNKFEPNLRQTKQIKKTTLTKMMHYTGILYYTISIKKKTT